MLYIKYNEFNFINIKIIYMYNYKYIIKYLFKMLVVFFIVVKYVILIFRLMLKNIIDVCKLIFLYWIIFWLLKMEFKKKKKIYFYLNDFFINFL